MALLECPECKKSISEDARICPHCGFKLFNSSSLLITIILFFVIFISLGGLFEKSGITYSYIISFIIALSAAIYGYNTRKKPL